MFHTKLTCIFILFTLCLSSSGQHIVYGHSHNSPLIDASFLKSPDGLGGKIGFTRNNKNFSISQFALSYEAGNKDKMDFNIYAFDYNHMWTLLDMKKNFYINIGPGAQVGYETTESLLTDQTTSGFVVGLSAKLELEYFINRIGLFANVQQYYLPVSEIADLRLRYHFGIKYAF